MRGRQHIGYWTGGVPHGAVSHVAWTTDDLPSERQYLASAGCPLLTTSVGRAVAGWFSGGSLLGHPIEVHQPTEGVLSFWLSLRARPAVRPSRHPRATLAPGPANRPGTCPRTPARHYSDVSAT